MPKSYDRHDCLIIRYSEENAKRIRVTHTHDEGVKPHSSGLQNKIRSAQAIVKSTPTISDLIEHIPLKKPEKPLT